MLTAKALMVQGTSSGAGKSYLVAALLRAFSDAGLRVAPFKAQNMSNNAGVVRPGLEIGRAQLLQAVAARAEPSVDMNPVLIKPEAGGRSQVVVLGRPDPELSALPWQRRKERLWPVVQAALERLQGRFDLLILEGAGSPAEVNLRRGDIANMRVAQAARAPVLLTCDIDRGGAFAHLLGTLACLPQRDRALVQGFLLNRFRGDPALLGSGPRWLERRSGVPVLGVIPWLPVPLPEEDDADLERRPTGPGPVAIVRLPHLSNFDEFAPLGQLASWVDRPAQLEGASWVILPGSKSTLADLDWLRATGLAAAIARAAQAGLPVLGICGGMQMLGGPITDPWGVEGGGGEAQGTGLLDLATSFAPQKAVRQRSLTDPLSQLPLRGYEIHHGETVPGSRVQTLVPGLLWRQGNVFGTYLHGLLETPAYLHSWLERAGLPVQVQEDLDARLDAVATQVRAHLDWPRVWSLATEGLRC